MRSRAPETVCGPAKPANEAKRMPQVLNQADGEGRGGVQRYPLSPNPSPQAIPTRPRGIKFPIIDGYNLIEVKSEKDVKITWVEISVQ